MLEVFFISLFKNELIFYFETYTGIYIITITQLDPLIYIS
jgi:hypothetical protein